MSMILNEYRIENRGPISKCEFTQFGDNTFECRTVICPEDEGGFSAFALRLPGVVSQGETRDEALKNLRGLHIHLPPINTALIMWFPTD